MAGKKTEAEIEAMSDEERRAWAESDEDDAAAAQSTEDEESEDDGSEETTTDEDGSEQGDEGTEEEEAESTKDWNPDGPGNPRAAIKAKNAEIKALKGQLTEQNGKIDQLTSLVAQLMAQGMSRKEATAEAKEQIEQQAQEDSEPDFEDDPVAWAAWLKRQSKKEVEAVEKRFEEYRSKAEAEKTTSSLRNYEIEFAKQNPDYFEVVNLQDENNLLTQYYAKYPTIFEAHMASNDPVTEAYELGKALMVSKGIAPKAPSKQSASVEQPAIKVKGKSAPPSLATIPSTREKVEQDSFGELSEEEVASLSPRQREKYLRGA